MKNLINKVNLFYKIAIDLNQLQSIDENTDSRILESIYKDYKNNEYNKDIKDNTGLKFLILDKAIETHNYIIIADIARSSGIEYLTKIVEKVDDLSEHPLLIATIVSNRNCNISILEKLLDIANRSGFYKSYIDERIRELKSLQEASEDIQKDNEVKSRIEQAILDNLGYQVSDYKK